MQCLVKQFIQLKILQNNKKPCKLISLLIIMRNLEQRNLTITHLPCYLEKFAQLKKRKPNFKKFSLIKL